MAGKDRKKGPGGEVIAQFITRAVEEPAVRQFMTWLKTQHEDSHNLLAWMYSTPEGKESRDIFTASILAAGTIIETAGDWSGLPEWIMEPVESFFGDLPGSFNRYFDKHKPTLPEGYQPTAQGPEAVKEFATKTIGNVREWAKQYFAQFKDPLVKTFWSLFKDPRERQLQNMAKLPADVRQKFMANVSAQPEAERKVLARLMYLVDEFSEMAFIASLEKDELKELIDWLKEVGDQHHVSYYINWIKERWPQVEQKVGEILAHVASTIDTASTELETHTAERKKEITDDLYSDENLEKHPFLRHNLAPSDPRRITVEAKLRPKRPMLFLVLGGIFIMTLVIGALVSLGDGSKPDVYITNPAPGQTLADSSLTVEGLAIDDHTVTKIEVQIDQFPRETLVFLPAPRVAWKYPVHLRAGTTIVSVWVYDRSNQKAAAQIRLNYQPVVKMTSSTGSDSLQGETNG